MIINILGIEIQIRRRSKLVGKVVTWDGAGNWEIARRPEIYEVVDMTDGDESIMGPIDEPPRND